MGYLVAILLALIAVGVILLIFKSIASGDINVVTAPADRKPRSKKSRKPSKRYTEVLDIETEALIAREIAKNPNGLSKDSKDLQPETLEAVREKHHAKHEQQQRTVVRSETETARARLIDRELGFQIVEEPVRQPKAERKAGDEDKAEAVPNDMEARLSNFFKNSKQRQRRTTNPPVEKGDEKAKSQPRIVVNRDITTARKWQAE